MSCQIYFINKKVTLFDNQILENIKKELALIGYSVKNVESITTKETLQNIAKSIPTSNMIILIGGCGSKEEDKIKQQLAKAVSTELIVDKKGYDKLVLKARENGTELQNDDIKQVMIPSGALALPNDNGTEIGCVIKKNNQYIIVLPENTREYADIFFSYLYPFLLKYAEIPNSSSVVKLFCKRPDTIYDGLEDMLMKKNPCVAIYENNGEFNIRITVASPEVSKAHSVNSTITDTITKKFEKYIYNMNDRKSLPEITINSMMENEIKLSIAESGTDGVLLKSISSVPQFDNVYKYGVLTPDKKSKYKELQIPKKLTSRYSDVSREVAVAMALSVKNNSHTDIGVAITSTKFVKNKPGIAYVALSDGENVAVQAIDFDLSDTSVDTVEAAIANNALNMILSYSNDDSEFIGSMVPYMEIDIKETTNVANQTRELLDDTAVIIQPTVKKNIFVRLMTYLFPAKGDTAKDIVLKTVFVLCILGIIGSAWYVADYFIQISANKQVVQDVADIYKDSQKDPTDGTGTVNVSGKEVQSKFAPLLEKNKDVVGWLEIEGYVDAKSGLGFSYPVLKREENNEYYYLRRDFDEKQSLHGSIFMDARMDVSQPGKNMILYGHNVYEDGQMFAPLINYKNIEFYKQYPVIQFDTLYQNNSYKVVASFVSNTKSEHGEVFHYLDYSGQGVDQNFLDFMYQVDIRSMIDTGVDILPDDDILLLSTCTYEFADARFVVVARKVRDGESDEVDTSVAKKANTPLMPDVWYELFGGQKPLVQPTRPADWFDEVEDVVSLNNNLNNILTTLPLSKVEYADKDETQEENDATNDDKLEGEKPTEEKPKPEEDVKPEEDKADSKDEEDKTTPEDDKKPDEEKQDDEKPKPEEEKPKPEENLKPEEEKPAPEENEQEVAPPVAPQPEPEPNPTPPQADTGETLRVTMNGVTGDYPLAQVLEQVVAGEMGYTMGIEAYKAQAIVSHTFIKYENNAGRTPYIPVKEPNQTIKNAVAAVLNSKVYYGSSLAFTPYFAMSAGNTESSQNVWGGHYPYLVSVDSSVESSNSLGNFAVTKTFTSDQIKQAFISSGYNIDFSSDPSSWITITQRASGKYVSSLDVCGTQVGGRAFREKVMGYKIRSHAFDISYDGANFNITTYGYGHGVGLSQEGANLYAKNGWSYSQIIAHYYPGTTIQ